GAGNLDPPGDLPGHSELPERLGERELAHAGGSSQSLYPAVPPLRRSDFSMSVAVPALFLYLPTVARPVAGPSGGGWFVHGALRRPPTGDRPCCSERRDRGKSSGLMGNSGGPDPFESV